MRSNRESATVHGHRPDQCVVQHHRCALQNQSNCSADCLSVLSWIQASDGLRFFNEHLQDYIGVLACFPPILGIHKVRRARKEENETDSSFVRRVRENSFALCNNAVLQQQLITTEPCNGIRSSIMSFSPRSIYFKRTKCTIFVTT